ncbi:hypothetical protein EXIGLDRAFT_833644 [Exidia glandulosa HHB12029]|uniref:RanBD1 domain-containing protein n=1 Tax=Exidia glandulosa HHB12029 TaxID=1314781 RepID=A0A165KIT1_EXIGL|nr:hypothetical protein EXIGLDRAFT_833644 [Exidia glandulosa HHB12029]
MSASQRTSPQPDAEGPVETTTPLPPSPTMTTLDDVPAADGPVLGSKRQREVSLEPSTPKPDDVDADPMDGPRERRAPATKRNRMQTIGDDDEPQPRVSPPRSPPHSPVSLSSSPRHESNLRHMNRGVRKLNMREGSRARRTGTRDSRSSRERDNRSSGSGSPRLEDDEEMTNGEPALASGRQSPARGEDGAPSAASATDDALPAESPKAHVLPTPPNEEEQQQMDEDRTSPKDVPAAAPESDDAAVPVPGDACEDADKAEPMEHEATAPLSATDAPPTDKDAPAAMHADAEKPLVASASIESRKRPHSEEVEEVGRPRSPPPPRAASPAKASFGFSAFSTNPMQLKASEPSIWGDSNKSSAFKSPSFGGSNETKPSGFSAWASPSGTSPFASASSAAVNNKFTSTFTYKSTSPSPFVMPKPVQEKSEKPVSSGRQIQGGGFGAFSSANAARFGSPLPKTRALTPDGSTSSSQERKKNGSPNGTSESGDEEDSTAFSSRLAEAGAETGDEDNEKKLNLTEQEVMTGEEEETTVHQTRAKLFVMEQSNSWKERGTGMLKLNVRKSDRSAARIVMRAEGVYRVILNEPLFSGMNFSVSETVRTVTFGGAPQADGRITLYTLRFSNAKIAKEVKEVLAAHVPCKKTEDTTITPPPEETEEV